MPIKIELSEISEVAQIGASDKVLVSYTASGSARLVSAGLLTGAPIEGILCDDDGKYYRAKVVITDGIANMIPEEI